MMCTCFTIYANIIFGLFFAKNPFICISTCINLNQPISTNNIMRQLAKSQPEVHTTDCLKRGVIVSCYSLCKMQSCWLASFSHNILHWLGAINCVIQGFPQCIINLAWQQAWISHHQAKHCLFIQNRFVYISNMVESAMVTTYSQHVNTWRVWGQVPFFSPHTPQTSATVATRKRGYLWLNIKGCHKGKAKKCNKQRRRRWTCWFTCWTRRAAARRWLSHRSMRQLAGL